MNWNTFEIRDGKRLGCNVDGEDGWYIESDEEKRDVEGPFEDETDAEAEAARRSTEPQVNRWEWGTGFDSAKEFVGPPSQEFATEAEAKADAVACGYGDDPHLIVRRVR